jgi:hypothetical protein
MNYLLYQPARLADSNQVYYNGKLIDNAVERSEKCDFILNLFRKTGPGRYPSMGEVDGYFVVRGLFAFKDEKGRQMSFLFASNSETYYEELLAVAKEIGYDLNEETLSIIKQYKDNKKSWVNKSIFTIVIVCIILLIMLLCRRNLY